MKPTKKHYIAYMLPLLLYLLFWQPMCASASTPVEQVPTGYKVVPIEKLELLRSNSAKLAQKLAELQLKLELLKTPSAELVKQLTSARSELELCKKELKSAKTSLENAKALQQRALTSLELLEDKIEAERKQQARTEKRLKNQRDFWIFLAGITAIIGAAK